jgi:hypothetical protein
MLYALAQTPKDDCMTVRVDNGIGVAAMKGGKILELPLELGFIMCGEEKLKDILKHAKKSGNYAKFASELGIAVGNLSMLLGVKKVFLVGEIIKLFDDISAAFDESFKSVDKKMEYEVSKVTDASEGAARVAMTEYPRLEDI